MSLWTALFSDSSSTTNVYYFMWREMRERRSNMKAAVKVGRQTEISSPKKSGRSEHSRHPIFHDEFNCRCSICRNFYKTLINGGRNYIYMNPPLCLPKEKVVKPFVHNWIKLGDRVVVKEKFSGQQNQVDLSISVHRQRHLLVGNQVRKRHHQHSEFRPKKDLVLGM
ncbi:uncharacterized protein LOC117119050 [Anneissia japonica]|uniref:uncharacterized protein LOC117119050 n=1 Tax=Anneissia japonica TaxID=1529436 RepID=UPI00142595C1|nr:uncharacterized protein LOC117119050 [Anneissia japonica]